VAFGPSFAQIANKRTKAQIQGHIINPKAMYKQLGHKRSVMPAFGDKLSQKELDLITKFIQSFKGVK
jgi:mono/diheme cytochrome c family protein